MARQMEKAIRESAYHTDDGDAADFYLIPGSGSVGALPPESVPPRGREQQPEHVAPHSPP